MYLFKCYEQETGIRSRVGKKKKSTQTWHSRRSVNTSQEDVHVHAERGDPNVPPPRARSGTHSKRLGFKETASSELADITR